MAKKLSLKMDTTSIVKSLRRVTDPLRTHHKLVMFVLFMGVLIYTAWLVSMTIQPTDDSEYRAQIEATSITTSFDQATIKKVDELRKSNDPSAIELPGGRRNPFVD